MEYFNTKMNELQTTVKEGNLLNKRDTDLVDDPMEAKADKKVDIKTNKGKVLKLTENVYKTKKSKRRKRYN